MNKSIIILYQLKRLIFLMTHSKIKTFKFNAINRDHQFKSKEAIRNQITKCIDANFAIKYLRNLDCQEPISENYIKERARVIKGDLKFGGKELQIDWLSNKLRLSYRPTAQIRLLLGAEYDI